MRCCAAIRAADEAFAPNARGRYMADLYVLARRRLAQLGVERVYGGGECTFARSDSVLLPPARRQTGRQATLSGCATPYGALNCPG